MNRRILAHSALATLVVLAVAACGDDANSTDSDADSTHDSGGDASGDSGSDAGSDATDDGSDDSDDALDAPTEDVGPTEDAAEDMAPDDDGDALEETVDADGGDVGDTTDVSEVDVVEEDVGAGCADDDTVCVSPYTCIGGVCRLPLAGTVWAESEFSIVEPSELTSIFALFKNLAAGVKFMVIDVADGEPPLATEYGTADIVDEDATPIDVWWQEAFELRGMVFSPLVDEVAPLDGDSWVSAPFLYSLRAYARVEFPGIEPIEAAFGLDAEQVEMIITRNPDVPDRALATIRGYVTRAEALRREMTTVEEFPQFASLFCARTNAEPFDGVTWYLSDLLDCNRALPDHDLSGLGSNDSYRIEISAVLEAARLTPL